MFDWIGTMVDRMGYGGVALFMFLENVFPPIPSEVIMPVAGFMSARDGMRFWLVVLAGTAGSLVGATVWYAIGRRIGERRLRAWVERHGRWIALAPADLDRSHRWFRRKGGLAVFLGRLVPAVRTFVSLPAGFAGMPLPRFLLYSAAGTFGWTLALTWAGLLLEENYARVERVMEPATWIVLALLLAGYIWRIARWRLAAHRPERAEAAG